MKRAAFALQANRARLTERFVKKEKAQPEEEDEGTFVVNPLASCAHTAHRAVHAFTPQRPSGHLYQRIFHADHARHPTRRPRRPCAHV